MTVELPEAWMGWCNTASLQTAEIVRAIKVMEKGKARRSRVITRTMRPLKTGRRQPCRHAIQVSDDIIAHKSIREDFG